MTGVFVPPGAVPPGPRRPTPPPAPPPGAAPGGPVHWRPARTALPASASAFVIALLVGVAGDVAAHVGLTTVGGAALVTAAAVGLAVSGRVRTSGAAALAGVALPFGVLAALRTSTWVVTLALVGAAVLVGTAASFAGGGSLLRQTRGSVAARVGRLVVSAFAGPSFLGRAMARALPPRARAGRVVAPVLRGALVAAPLLVLVGMLLASADAVFASFFRVPVGLDVVATHGLWIAAVAIAAGGLLREASEPDLGDRPRSRVRVGAAEANVVLAGLVAMYGLFVAAQVVVATGGAEVVLKTAGLTRADYARQGFFQLVAVAVITLTVLLVLRGTVRPARGAAARAFTVLAELAVLLTLAIVVVAATRMWLYDDAFGLTALRFWVMVTMGLIAVVFVLIGVALSRRTWEHSWLLPAVVASALAAVMAAGLLSPDALVARRNLDRLATTGQVDAAYLVTLSDDAVPVLLDGVDRFSPTDRAFVLARVCRPDPSGPPVGLRWNASAAAAADARARVCPR